MKKKLLSILMVAALAVSMTACGGSSDSEEAEDSSAEEATEESSGETYSIGICQLVQHEALDAATQGLEDALTEL